MRFDQSIGFCVIIIFTWRTCKLTTAGEVTTTPSNNLVATNAFGNESNAVTNTSASHGSTKIGPLWGFFNMFVGESTSSQQKKVCDCTCGVSHNKTAGIWRIVGGQESVPHKHPWMARLSYRSEQSFCGGSLINDRYVITAAHCTNSFSWLSIRYVKVTLGTHDKCVYNNKEWSSYVQSVTTPSFSFMPVFGTDIALIKLANRVPFNDFIKPICLPKNSDSDYSGLDGIVAGWGKTSEDGKSSCTLREVVVPIMTNAQCFKHTEYSNVSSFLNKENMMCAGLPQGGVDSCQGDSGGPLMIVREDRRHQIVGVVSFGKGCARQGFPGIYTRVTKHLNWINQNTRDGCYCHN